MAEPLRIAVIADLNEPEGSTGYSPEVSEAVARIIEIAPALMLSAGDMIAGPRPSPEASPDEIEPLWAAFHATVTDPLRAAGIPLLVTPGEQDTFGDPGVGAERQAFDRTWTKHFPEVEILDGEHYPFRYAVSFGGVLFLSLEATAAGQQPLEETEWLEQILIEEGPRHRARVVLAHLAPAAFSEGLEGEVIDDPELDRVLRAQNVSLYLNGHHHAYYPGVLDGLPIVSQPRLGSGPRRLIGGGAESPKGFTMLEIDDDGKITERALAAPGFRDEIDRSTLPAEIGAGTRRILRRDLAP